ncbi:hypothetical protein KVR01_012137 [Diaporthe batatas]|uniref:uncharacterized protein n=1 Tax=Diaporthe batatas TaxID=748121 RepID=UPI001D0554C7|nr:uncharacterized protein KVR01_012137 [Diaporthe batatas]KAG8157865.1 hypothetical protein KVR01_012137 [Diaporthe batatas]
MANPKPNQGAAQPPPDEPPNPQTTTTHTPTPGLKQLLPPATIEPSPEQPGKFFFYGSLMDPDVLYAITRSSAEPVLHKATIRGHKMKKWGSYPALIPGGAGDVVDGVYWEAEDAGQSALLQHYETNMYRPVACTIRVEKGDGGVVVEDGLVFVWAGNAGSEELEEGGFSLEEYRLHHKPYMFVPKPWEL